MKNKILFITPGHMPVKNKKGGGIESLLDIYFSHNSKTGNYEITAYSAYDHNDKPDADENYSHVRFRNIDISKRDDKILHKVARAFQVAFGRPCARYYIMKVLEDLKSRNEENAFGLIVVENCENDLAYIGKKMKTKTPIVLHLHNDYIYKGRKDAKTATCFLAQVWGVSNFIRDRVNEINPEADKAITIYNAVNLGKFTKKATEAEKQELQKKYNIKKSDYVFLYVGRIMKEKGVLEMIRAFCSLSSKYKNAKMLIVGGKKNSSQHNRYYEKIIRLAHKDKNVEMCGRVESDELYKYYQISHCQVIPSKWNEAFGLVALEGMVSGLRCIISNTGGLPEVIPSDANRAIVLSAINKMTIREAMIEMLKVSSRRTSRNNSYDMFSEEKFVTSIDECMKKAIKNEK